MNQIVPGAQRRRRILFVPGFVADTYCEIERSYVELCSVKNADFEFLWLVTEIRPAYDNFAKPENRSILSEAVYVRHLRQNGIPYVVGHISKFNVLSNLFLFWRLFRSYHIDAVFTHFGYERFWATFFGKLFGKTTIWNEHWHALGMKFRYWKRVFYFWFVDEFIAVSAFLASTLRTTAPIHIIRNGIWPHASVLSKEERSDMRASLGIPSDAIVIVMVAAFKAQKRHLVALSVCEKVLKEHSNVMFIFLGDGPERDQFMKLIHEKRIDQHIRAPGYVQNVDDYYAVSDLSILTSHNEGFGYVVLEAMKYALPVCVFNTGAPAEVVRNGDTGFVIQDGDIDAFSAVVEGLVEDESLRREIGVRARRSVRDEHSREMWIKNVNSTLSAIVNRQNRALEDVSARGNARYQ